MWITVTRPRLEKLIREELGLGNGNIEGMRDLMDEMILESSGFADTAAEEAAKINSQVGASYSTDQSYWGDLGIVTGEDLARSVLAQTYSDRYKSSNGIRPRWVKFDEMSIDEIQAMINDLDDEEDDYGEEDRDYQDYEDRDYASAANDEIEAEKEIMRTPEEGEDLPKTMGMGRRPLEGPARLVRRGRKISEEKHVKVTRRQLRKFIFESINEILQPDRVPSDYYEQGRAPTLMSITDDMLKGIELEEADGVVDDTIIAPPVVGEMEIKLVRNLIDAYKSLRNGESIRYPLSAQDLDSLLGLSQGGVLNDPAMGFSSDQKMIMGAVGVVSVLILVAVALGYSVKVKGKAGDTEGELVLQAPGDTFDEIEVDEEEVDVT